MFGIQKSEWTRCWWILLLIAEANSIEWKHSAILDNNFLVLWTPGESDITFEVQVKTPGYVGFGFTKDDGSESVDMVIGWVDNNGQVHLQDRHIKGANRDPQMDSSQDYHLQSGYENKTHTVLRFNRRYDTCDPRDLKITNDTLKIVWQYHVDEPVSASGVLPVDGAVRGTRPLYLVQLRENRPQRRNSRNDDPDGQLQSWDVLNTGVRLPMDQDTLLQCRIFKAPKLPRKHHVIRYEPVIQPGSQDYLHHMTLFECRGSDEILLEQARIVNGSSCGLADRLHAQCSSPVATWSIGSEGFAFPSEAGLPLEAWPTPGAPKYYLLETHYSNPLLDAFVTDSSGLRLWHTERLRRHDAGLLSIGIEPNWRHIIPPGQSEVISEGHCISRCTESALPDHGVNVFSVVMHTHQLGKKVRLRQIRGSRELPPIVADGSYEPSYQESRNLQTPAKVLPGDHLIAECTYSSKKRQTITLGGLSDKEETCLVSVLYYPRQLDLSLCYSLPSLPTVLHSLGIDKLEGPSPLRIISPPELRGMTLEERLVSYDWRESYQSFLDATRKGTFKALCTDAKGLVLPDSNVEAHYPRVIWPYQDAKLPCTKKPQLQRNKLSMLLSEDDDIDGQQQQQQQQNNHNHYDNEYESNTVERGQLVRNKFSRSSESSLTAAASSRSIFCPGLLLTIAFSSLLMMTAVR